MESYKDELSRIKKILIANPRGLTITEISHQIDINRNSVAKYLDVLVTSGHVGKRQVGPAKVYFHAPTVPIFATLNLSSDYILIVDSKLRVWYINEHLLTFERITRQDVIGKDIRDVTLGVFSGLEIFPQLEECLKGREVSIEHSIEREGKPLFFRIKINSSVFDDGTHGIIVILEDISDQKRYEKTLEMSEALYRAVVEDQTEMISRFTPDGRHLFVNESYCRYFGRKREEILGQVFRPEIPEEDRISLKKHFASLTPEHPVGLIEHRTIQPGGEICWQQWTDRAFFGADGSVVECQSVGRDITVQKQMEKRLNDQLFFLQEMLNCIPIPVFYKDTRGVYLGCNKKFEEYTGRSRDQIIGKTVYDVWSKELADMYNAKDVELMKRSQSLKYESKMRDSQGTLREVLCFKSPFHNRDGSLSGSIGVMLDMTEQKKTEIELKKQQYDLKERIKELNCLYDFFTIIDKLDSRIEDKLKDIANRLPEAFVHPEKTCARIVIDDRVYLSNNFYEFPVRYASEITLHGRTCGSLVVCYAGEDAGDHKFPFLPEELKLVNSIATRIGRVVERLQYEKIHKDSGRKLQSY